MLRFLASIISTLLISISYLKIFKQSITNAHEQKILSFSPQSTPLSFSMFKGDHLQKVSIGSKTDYRRFPLDIEGLILLSNGNTLILRNTHHRAMLHNIDADTHE